MVVNQMYTSRANNVRQLKVRLNDTPCLTPSSTYLPLIPFIQAHILYA